MLGSVALAWALVVGGVELEAMRRLVFTRRRVDAAPMPALTRARVLVIRPCAGRDPWLAKALTSLADARRSFDLSCRVAIADATDGAHDTAIEAASALTTRGLDAKVILTSPRGPNRKASQLARVVAGEAPFDVVIVADGDVDLAGMDLDALVAPLLARADLGAIWAPPTEIADAQTTGDRASAALLGASLHAFPVLAKLDRTCFVGKLFAVRQDALELAGGFDALVNHLGEDMELARRLHASGLAIEAAPIVARSLSSGRSFADVEERFSRWIKVIRAQRPRILASYPALFFATLPIVILAAIAAFDAPRIAMLAASYAVVMRLVLARVVAYAAGRRTPIRRLITDAILADVLLARAFARALRSRRVVWRDVTLTIDRGGALRLVEKGS